MFIKYLLALAPLTQFALANNAYCPPYGPKKSELKASHVPAYGGYRTYVFCDNIGDDGCPQKLDGPYGPYDQQKCQVVEQGDSSTSYKCNSSDDISDFKSKAEGFGWKCRVAQS